MRVSKGIRPRTSTTVVGTPVAAALYDASARVEQQLVGRPVNPQVAPFAARRPGSAFWKASVPAERYLSRRRQSCLVKLQLQPGPASMSRAQPGDQLVHVAGFWAAGGEGSHPCEAACCRPVEAGVGVLKIGEHKLGVDRQDSQRSIFS